MISNKFKFLLTCHPLNSPFYFPIGYLCTFLASVRMLINKVLLGSDDEVLSPT